MTNQSAIEIVSAYQDAWTHKDFDTAARYLAEDIVFHSSGQHLTRIGEFLTMLTAFAERIQPRWKRSPPLKKLTAYLSCTSCSLGMEPRRSVLTTSPSTTARSRVKRWCSIRRRSVPAQVPQPDKRRSLR